MFGLQLDWDGRYLWLLAIVPFIWILSFRSLSGLGSTRRILALMIRTAVLLLLILALANVQLVRTMEKMTVVYLLDQSASIPPEQRETMVDYVVEEVRLHRNDSRRDRAAVIVFGHGANIEVPPLEDELPLMGRLESTFDLRADATNLAAAMKLAQATFPEDSARRIVVITDGNENMGDARAMAQLLAKDGVGVDVIPVPLEARTDVSVERVALPAGVRRGEPFDAMVVLNSTAPPTVDEPAPVSGTLRLQRRMGNRVETLDEAEVQLAPGKKEVFRFQHEIDQPDFYEYQATFIPADPNEDRVPQNNRATAFTHVGGQGHVLLIEDFENRDSSGRGEFDILVQRLRALDIEVTVQFTDDLFTSLAELQRYDTIILGNVPRSSGESADSMVNFSDPQIRMLVRNTQEMGCGLIMMGGENSFGAGGWANTELEKAMPVDFRIHNAKVQAVGALAMVMHASEMGNGNYWQKVIAREALKSLGPHDYCGVVHWMGKEEWLWGKPQGLVRVGDNRKKMVARLSRMTPGDMPEFGPSMKMAAAGFAKLDAAAHKHMIIISDGDPSPPRPSTTASLKNLDVKVTTVAVGAHGGVGHKTLQDIAAATGGKYYVVTNPQALPRIYQREARRIARPLVRERRVQPQIKTRHEIYKGIEGPPPPIDGFVMTTLKENPLVEVQLVSPEPADQRNATLLATWQFNLGRTAVFTTDAGYRWATDWTGWEGYDKLFTQLVRWSMRPSGDTGNFTVATERKEGKVRVVVTAMDKDDEFLNFLDMAASVVGPDMEPLDVTFAQIAPGRYVGEFDSDKDGSYFLTISPGAGRAPIRTGINIPYSSEYRDRDANLALLDSLAGLEPTGGNPGRTIAGTLTKGNLDQLLTTNTFRHDLAKAVSSDYVWPLLLLAAGCVFFADVFVRRVSVSLEWVTPLWTKARDTVLRREPEAEPDQRLARLRSRKAEIGDQIDSRRAATRFEPTTGETVDPANLTDVVAGSPSKAKNTAPSDVPVAPEAQEEEDQYTSRLLKAKKQVWEDDRRRPSS